MLTVTYANCHLCLVARKRPYSDCIYAECHVKALILSVFMLNVVMLSVVAAWEEELKVCNECVEESLHFRGTESAWVQKK